MKLGKARIKRTTFETHMFLEMTTMEAVCVIVVNVFLKQKTQIVTNECVEKNLKCY